MSKAYQHRKALLSSNIVQGFVVARLNPVTTSCYHVTYIQYSLIHQEGWINSVLSRHFPLSCRSSLCLGVHMCLVLITCLCLCLCLCMLLLGVADSPISKPTPLYGQPSWWGEDEDPNKKEQNSGGKSPEHGLPGKRMCQVFSHVYKPWMKNVNS